MFYPLCLPLRKNYVIVCKRGFAQSTSLRTHARIHTGERPYICNVCHKGFHASGPLHIHMRTHLKMEKETLGSDAKIIEVENKNEELSIETNVDQPNEEPDHNFSSLKQFVETINESIVMIEITEEKPAFGFTKLISKT